MTITEPAPLRVTAEDGSRWYTHPVTGERLTSVTTILGGTEGKPWLTAWSAKLAAEYAVDHLALLDRTNTVEGREAAVELAKNKAKEVRERKADAGSYVHAVAEALILWAASPDGMGADLILPTLPDHLVGTDYDGEPLGKVVDWMITGFTQFVADWGVRFQASEMAVFHCGLGIAGTLDGQGFLPGMALTAEGKLTHGPGVLLDFDIKTGRDPGATVREQLAAYRRMTECLMPHGDVVPKPASDGVAVLHLRPGHHNGYQLMPIAPAEEAAAWVRFRHAIEVFTGREQQDAKPGIVARPPLPDGSFGPPLLADLAGEVHGRILTALRREGGLVHVGDVALWTVAELLAVKGIGPKSIPAIADLLDKHGYLLAAQTLKEVA